MEANISFLVAFGAGLLSFLSPCVLPLVPVMRPIGTAQAIHSQNLSLGCFSVVFTLFGAGAGLVGFALSAHLTVIRWIAGSLLIIFGLFLLVALKVPWLNFEKRLAPSQGTTAGYVRSFLTGGIFSVAWTPCVGPILGGILAIALGSETAWQGAYLLATYSLGLGLPFLAIGVAFDSIIPLLRRIHRYSTAVYIFSGILLIAVGILILMDKMTWFLT